MKIAVHQMCSSTGLDRNIDSMVSAIGQASANLAEMYFAPEMSVLVDRDRNRAGQNIFREPESVAVDRLSAAARNHRIWVHMGSMPMVADDGAQSVNRSIVFGPDGNIRARYDKIHLFDVDLASGESWRESAAYQGGQGPVAVATPLGLLGLSICYDVRFPDLFSAYAKSRVDILAVPSAFTVPTGDAHWHVLLRARAIESEAFVVAPAQSGTHEDGRQTYGHSLVVDPWGKVLLDMGGVEGLGFVDLDLNRLHEVRAQIPVHANRRDISLPVRIV